MCLSLFRKMHEQRIICIFAKNKKIDLIMAKKKKSNGFLWGLIIGVILTAGAVYYYQNYYNKTDLEKKTQKLEKKAKKEIDKAEEGVKKLFDK